MNTKTIKDLAKDIANNINNNILEDAYEPMYPFKVSNKIYDEVLIEWTAEFIDYKYIIIINNASGVDINSTNYAMTDINFNLDELNDLVNDLI